ncbi:hypothetical protein BRADI_1g47117v3 [Brachypodium distachyon]|uniref:RNase III domain-containing protein n=1 Tax=Brachypodium distachyon TaxID=15368 RepID=A0A0Q3K467_BRADI|nr:hypothetical protein BRADI_1g47117v3 [Brachypodium distachyon]
MKPGSRKRGPPPPGFVEDRSEAAARVERLLQYRFHDRALLELALTHQSFSGGAASYQRLEFLGDAALDLAFSDFLYRANPTLGPGELTTLRAANISTEKLARVAVRHDLYPLLRRACPPLDLLVGQFIELVKQELEDDFSTAPYGGCVVKAPKVLADIVEAIAAAVYMDCKSDIEKFWKVTRRLFEPLITVETMHEQPMSMLNELCQKHGMVPQFKESKKVSKLLGDPKQQVLTTGVGPGLVVEVEDLRECKQKLNEQCSKKHWPKPIFKLEKEDGPAHDRKFMYSVEVETQNGTYFARGDPMSRVKYAENSGGQKMLELLLKLKL